MGAKLLIRGWLKNQLIIYIWQCLFSMESNTKRNHWSISSNWSVDVQYFVSFSYTAKWFGYIFFFFFKFFSIIGHEKILNIVLVLEYFLKWVSLTSLSMKFLIYLLDLLPTMIKPYKFRPETPNLPQFIYWYFCLTGLYCHTVLLAGAMFLYCCQSLSHVWLCNRMDDSTPGFPVLHYLLKFAQIHVHWVSDAI